MYNLLNISVVKNIFNFTLAKSVLILILVFIKSNVTLSYKDNNTSLELQGIAESGNLFAEDLYKALLNPGNGEPDDEHKSYENENLMISPLSIHIGLAMLLAGSVGQTEQEILQGLRIRDNMEETEIRNGYHDMITNLKDNVKNGVELQLANKIFVGQSFPIKPNYLDVIRHNYFADAEQVNFGEAESTANKVNGWVQKATRNRIKEIISPNMLNNQTDMILLSAIHFKGEWKFPFDPENTKKRQFTTIKGDKVSMKMMKLNAPERFKYALLPHLKSSAIALPFVSDRHSMIILLPDKAYNLKEVEDRIQDGTLASIPSQMIETLADVVLPKTTLESEIDLIGSKVIKQLNMTRMTTSSAEFGKISDKKGILISNIIHKSFLDINEAGSEAAAATAIVVQARTIVFPAEVTFVVDRPFIAYIYDFQTKTILFLARKIY